MSNSRLALLVVLGLTACGQQAPAPPPSPAAAAQPEPAAAPTVEQLQSATVSGVLEQPVTLANGVYNGPPAQPGAASHPTLRLLDPSVIVGNVDGAAGSEAIALLSLDTGGSGEFVHVGVFGLSDGKAVTLGTAPVGDRVKIEKIWLEKDQIHMDVVEAGPKDPACCPTQLSRKTFAMQAGALRQVDSQVVGALSVNLLGSTDWVLAQMDGAPVPSGVRPPTLLVEYGKATGFGGCNRYVGPITETKPGQVSVGPLAATKKACPDAEMEYEQEFLSRMNAVKSYTFLAGQLALNWKDKDRAGLLVFRR